MNRTSFLFLILLIGSSLLTVNSRNEARNLISEKNILNEKIASLTESLRRTELQNARLSAKTIATPPVPVENISIKKNLKVTPLDD